jgi:hypothetical protein
MSEAVLQSASGGAAKHQRVCCKGCSPELRAKGGGAATAARRSCERYSTELRAKGGGAAKASRRSCKVCSLELRAKGADVAKASRWSCKGCSSELKTLLAGAASEGWRCCKATTRSCKGCSPELRAKGGAAANAAQRSCKGRPWLLQRRSCLLQEGTSSSDDEEVRMLHMLRWLSSPERRLLASPFLFLIETFFASMKQKQGFCFAVTKQSWRTKLENGSFLFYL